MPVEVLLRYESFANLYVQDKVERQSSFNLGRTVVAQIAELVPNPLARGTLPAAVSVQAITNTSESRQVVEGGAYGPNIVNRVATWHQPTNMKTIEVRNTSDRSTRIQ